MQPLSSFGGAEALTAGLSPVQESTQLKEEVLAEELTRFAKVDQSRGSCEKVQDKGKGPLKGSVVLGQKKVESWSFMLCMQNIGKSFLSVLQSICSMVSNFWISSFADEEFGEQDVRKGGVLDVSIHQVSDQTDASVLRKWATPAFSLESYDCALVNLSLPTWKKVARAFWSCAWFMYKASEDMDLVELQKKNDVSSPKCYHAALDKCAMALCDGLKQLGGVAIVGKDGTEPSPQKMLELSSDLVNVLQNVGLGSASDIDGEWENVVNQLVDTLQKLKKEVQSITDEVFPGERASEQGWIGAGFTQDEFKTLQGSLAGIAVMATALEADFLKISQERALEKDKPDHYQKSLEAWLTGSRAYHWFSSRHKEKERDLPRIWISPADYRMNTDGSMSEITPGTQQNQKDLAERASMLVELSSSILDDDGQGTIICKSKKQFYHALQLAGSKHTPAEGLSQIIGYLCSKGHLDEAKLCLRVAALVQERGEVELSQEDSLVGSSGVSGIVLGWELVLIAHMSLDSKISLSDNSKRPLCPDVLPSLHQEYVTFVCSTGNTASKSKSPSSGLWAFCRDKMQQMKSFMGGIVRQTLEGQDLHHMSLETLFGAARDVHRLVVETKASSVQSHVESLQTYLIDLRECVRKIQKKVGTKFYDPLLQKAYLGEQVNPVIQRLLNHPRLHRLYSFSSSGNLNPLIDLVGQVPKFARSGLSWRFLDHPGHYLQKVLVSLYKNFVTAVWNKQFVSDTP